MICGRCGTTRRQVEHSDALDQDVCLRCYEQHAPAPTVNRWDAALAELTRYEQAQERKRVKAKGSPIDTLAVCEQIALEIDEEGWPVIVDPVLHVVLTECPACHAERRDPLSMFLPLRIIPRPDGKVFRCQACGWERVDRWRHAQTGR